MEIYLSHMVFFRILEKLHMTHLSSNEIVSYVIVIIAVLLFSSVFSIVVKRLIDIGMKKAKLA